MDENQRALGTSLRILIKKNYSKREIEKKLVGYTYSEESIEFALEELAKLGFIDDLDYAKQIVLYYKERGYGKNRIKQELYKRLLDKEIIDELLYELDTNFDKILAFYHQKLKGEIDDFNQIQKTKAALVRKGFSFDEINDGFLLYKEKLEDYECL